MEIPSYLRFDSVMLQSNRDSIYCSKTEGDLGVLMLKFRCLMATSWLMLAISPAVADEREIVEFNRDIRPILADNCYACHGPDQQARQAELRLDLPYDRVVDGNDPVVIVPGQPDESELIRRIFSDDPLDIMPPAEHRKKLTVPQKLLFKRWIEQGAEWQGHWAWLPLGKNPPPSTTAIQSNYIDQRVAAALAGAKLKASPEADRVTLLRRLYFDLLGLPPAPEQVEVFLADKSANAYEKTVDELLQSPHFGERMASYWLDQVRYADTVGYHGDQDVSVSPYRDYVIQTFNSNKPFDEFTREQLAGDLLVSPTTWQRVASGYNRLGMMSAEGGVQPEEYLAKYAADRVRTTSSVWLGVTLGCAECHDHKFDPFSIDDFYSFASFFADIQERGLYDGAHATGDWGSQIDVPDEELAGLLKPIDQRLETIRATINLQSDGLATEQANWEIENRSRSIRWTALRPREFNSINQTKYQILDDHSVLLTGESADKDCYLLTVDLPPGEYKGLRLEALPHDSLPQRGPGRAGNGNFVLTEMLLVRQSLPEQPDELRKPFEQWSEQWKQRVVPLVNATATIEQAASAESNPDGKWAAASVIDHEIHGPNFGWAILPESGQENELVVNFEQPLALTSTEPLTIVLQQYHGQGNHVLGHFRISVTDQAAATANSLKSLPADIREILLIESTDRTVEQSTRLGNFYLTIAPRFANERQQIAAAEKQRSELIAARTRTSLVTVAVEPRPIRVLPRGNWMDHTGALVSPRLPQLFVGENRPAETGPRLTRLDLANWIVDPDNPLTARVFVNRLWRLYFGTGLSKNLDDFGSQGEWPSHPELLDQLAGDFIESGFDMKHIIRQIVTSQTYRQSSQPRSELTVVDPDNRLLARQSRFRLDAELIRDNALTVSGLIVLDIGGRSAKPYQPAGLYQHLNFPPREYVSDGNRSQFRRGVYTHWQRQYLHPAMKSFDAPSREESACERPRSNTPIAALVMLNDPSYVEAARNLAASTLNESNQDSALVIATMFQRALSRRPTDREIKVLQRLFESHLQHYQVDRNEAEKITTIGISKRPDSMPVEQLAAWTSVARVIMNLHEFVTRY